MIQKNGTITGKNPVCTSLRSGPNTKPSIISELNKHQKSYQPLISSFFQKQIALDRQSQIDEAFQIELRNSFSVLVDESSEDLPEIDNVVNLSDRPLTDMEHKILNKGLNFCPTPGEPHMGDIRRDLDHFHRSLRIHCWLNKKTPPDVVENQIGPYNDTKSLKIKGNST